MNFTSFITHHGKKVSSEHFLHLVQVAKIEGTLKDSTLNLLHKEGKKFGLTDPEIDQLIKSESASNYHPPYSLAEKFDEMYNITEIMLEDDLASEAERKMIRKYAITAGFSDNVIENLINILVEGVAKGEDEEKLFKEFKKKVF